MRTIYLLILLLPFIGISQLPITKSEENEALIKAFGLELSKSFAEKQSDFLIQNFDLNSIYPNIILSNTNDSALKKVNKKFKSKIRTHVQSFSREMISSITEGNFYNFCSYFFDETDKTYHILFRSYQHETGINYHDYRLIQVNKKIKISDIYFYATNQLLSENLKLLYLNHISKKSLVSATEKGSSKFILMLKNYVDALDADNAKKAYQHISLLNKSLHGKNRFVAALKLKTARAISEEAYFEAMEDLLSTFKQDPSISLIAINYHYQNKDYEEIDIALNLLLNHTNDTFLDFEKGNLNYAKKEYENAVLLYETMIRNYPNFVTPYFSLLVTYNETRQTKAAINLLNTITKKTKYTHKELTQKVKEQLPFLSTTQDFKTWSNK